MALVLSWAETDRHHKEDKHFYLCTDQTILLLAIFFVFVFLRKTVQVAAFYNKNTFVDAETYRQAHNQSALISWSLYCHFVR